jgi:hypothetical protein
MDEILNEKVARISHAGRKLAAQLGCVFTIDRRKLRDFTIRTQAQSGIDNGD